MRALQMFAIYDSATEAFMAPIFLQTKGQAIRAFSDAANDPKHEIAQHPEDYTLFHVGAYNQENAELVCLQAPERVVTALEVTRPVEVDEQLNLSAVEERSIADMRAAARFRQDPRREYVDG